MCLQRKNMPLATSEPPKIFISYNRADRDWAEWSPGAIESAGYEPVIQAWHFRPGENFVLRMQEAAAQTNFTIAVLSETYLKSEYTQPEWAAAFAQAPTGKKRKLIPVCVAECALTGLLTPGRRAESSISTAPFPPSLARLRLVEALSSHKNPETLLSLLC
jgi:hypothetical protein